jgi:hypothetical protein
MKILVLTVLLVFVRPLFAQECTQELLTQKAGTWKAGRQGSIQNVSASDLVKEKAVLAAVHKMISSKYKPTGCEANFSTVYGKHLPAAASWIADPYHYTLYILRYLCDQKASNPSGYYIDHATPTTVNIAANVLFPLNTLYAGDIPADDTRGYLKLKTRPQVKDGFYFLGEEVVGDGDRANKIKEYRWLITYSDTLPFVYLTRKEYLLIQKKRLEQDIKDNPSEKTYLEKHLSNINEFLKKPESELNVTAISMWNEEQRFEKFVDEGTRGSFIAVKPNPAYYRKKLAKSVPQFFTVVYKISHGDPVFEKNISDIRQAVDFSALRNMLGK